MESQWSSNDARCEKLGPELWSSEATLSSAPARTPCRPFLAGLALPRLEPSIRLVDDVGTAAATDDAAVPVARLQGLQAIANLHGRAPASLDLFRCWKGPKTGGSPRERLPRSQVVACPFGSAEEHLVALNLHGTEFSEEALTEQ